jgi:hypothetical protein
MIHNVFNVRYKSPSNSLECFFYDSISKKTISCVILPLSKQTVCYIWNNNTVISLPPLSEYYSYIVEKTKMIESIGDYTILTENDISNTTYNNYILNKIEERILSKILCGICL